MFDKSISGICHYLGLKLGSFALLVSMFAVPAHSADTALIEAARKEGALVWYTVQIVDLLARPLAAAFTKKYGVNAEFVRSNSGEIALRILNEVAAGHVICDVFDGTVTVAPLEKRGLVERWLPDSAKSLPSQMADPAGYWVATAVNVSVPAVNTDLVAPSDEPRSWDDLLAPRWKDKMALSTTNSPIGSPGFVGLVIKTLGEERGIGYLKKLTAQGVANIPSAARQVLDQVIAGEYSLGINMVVGHIVSSRAQKAPVKALFLNSSLVSLQTASIAKNAPHPNAAKLFLDFLISEEGQAIYRDADYIPSNPAVPVSDPTIIPDGKHYRALIVPPEELDAELSKWYQLSTELFP